MEENTHILTLTKGCKLFSTIVKPNIIVIDAKETFSKRNLK
jgi:hypothetical protein